MEKMGIEDFKRIAKHYCQHYTKLPISLNFFKNNGTVCWLREELYVCYIQYLLIYL